jgi:hypothetical protein
MKRLGKTMITALFAIGLMATGLTLTTLRAQADAGCGDYACTDADDCPDNCKCNNPNKTTGGGVCINRIVEELAPVVAAQ